jgi:hypothetical protein
LTKGLVESLPVVEAWHPVWLFADLPWSYLLV